MNNRILRQAGLSLIELMIALTIGLLLLSGLTMIFINSSEANRELQKTAQQIENGRYAVELISQDLRLAGFYGHLSDLTNITVPAFPPDPCESSSVSDLLSHMRYPVQGTRGIIHSSNPASDTAASVSATCATLLTAANLKAGSDVVVIRRADTNALATTEAAAANVFFIQASAIQAEVQLGNGATIGNNKANGAVSTLYLTNGATPPPPAPIRRLRVHIYFVAPCSVGSAANGACTGASGEDTIPTLKRLELTSSGTITIVPLVEGIEYLKLEYGIDDTPGTTNLATGLIGDSNVDRYKETPTAAEWESVISAKVYVLARNSEPTTGFVDNKTYTLGSPDATDNITVPQALGTNVRFKRHVYVAAVHLVNPAGRKEIP